MFHCVEVIISMSDCRVNLFNRFFTILRRSDKHRLGQAMVEYAVVAGVLMAVFLMLTVFLRVFGEYGARILDMVAADYP